MYQARLRRDGYNIVFNRAYMKSDTYNDAILSLTNLLTLWLVGLIFPGILIVCLFAFVCPPLAGPMAQFVSLGIRLLLSFVKWLAKFIGINHQRRKSVDGKGR